MISLRQGADVAIGIIDHTEGETDPQMRRAMDSHFAAQRLHGPLTAEYVQGLFSGMYLAQDWLKKKNHDDEAVALVTKLTIELARKYVEQIESDLAGTSPKLRPR